MSVPVWQILIASVYARTGQLTDLLANLGPQVAEYGGAVEVLIDRDDCELPVGSKRTRLLVASRSQYVCFVDDDDQVADLYVHRIMEALVSRPDYVGFEVAYYVDGARQKPSFHSLEFPVWGEDERGYYRGISHLNPIRRDAALAGLPFLPGFGEDADWARRVQASGTVVREEYIPEPLYRYRYVPAASLFVGSSPRRLGYEPLLPSFPHVEVL